VKRVMGCRTIKCSALAAVDVPAQRPDRACVAAAIAALDVSRSEL